MNRPSSIEDRLAAWLEQGPTSGPDDALADALARTRSTRQRPGWLERLIGDTMESTWRAPDVRIARRLAFALLILMLALALTAGTLIVGAQLIRIIGPNDGPDALPAVALPPTACPAGTVLHSGDIATIAGTGVDGDAGDGGQAVAATISAPYGIAVGPTGAIYVGNSAGYYNIGRSHGVRRIDHDGVISTAAMGPTPTTVFPSPTGVTVDLLGQLYVADFNTARIWRVDATGTSMPVVGTGVVGSSGDGGPAASALISASNLAIGPAGDIYFDDWTKGWHKVDSSGIVRPFAGNGIAGFSGDGGPATDARVDGGSAPVALAVDLAGNVYLPDPGNSRIRRVGATGTITTFAGNGAAGHTGDGGPATEAAIGRSHGIAVDAAGVVYFSSDDQTVRRVDIDGYISTVVGTGSSGFSGDCGPATSAELSMPNGVSVHDGVLYIVDAGNHRIRIVVP